MESMDVRKGTGRLTGAAWIGWDGSPSDPNAETVEPFTADGIDMVPIALSAQEIEEYYEGFSNATLWPLYHDVIAPPGFHRVWWDSYVSVNQRFANAIASTSA